VLIFKNSKTDRRILALVVLGVLLLVTNRNSLVIVSLCPQDERKKGLLGIGFSETLCFDRISNDTDVVAPSSISNV
jgi:hypothetical protein